MARYTDIPRATTDTSELGISSLDGFVIAPVVGSKREALDQKHAERPTKKARTDSYRSLDTVLTPQATVQVRYPGLHYIRPHGQPLLDDQYATRPSQSRISNLWPNPRITRWMDDVLEECAERTPIGKRQSSCRLGPIRPSNLEIILAGDAMDMDEGCQLSRAASKNETQGSGQLSQAVDEMDIDAATKGPLSWEAMDVDQGSHASSDYKGPKFTSWMNEIVVNTPDGSTGSVRPSSGPSTWECIGLDIPEDVDMTDWCQSSCS
ncbi:uncharacterized protein NECHADRAFT_88863 [Fusarium vanettenii 77-13-4]|uniref:Uncharacterized protein n=1 Tax=Fusarium vanettenii (strain ATCC MYA-4622 / CBS 123669 / FGSC 9596 / NRRL 45880 / 77-13-4) TaxID=660122 RepID=C7ZN47_FUSV7|nr:uncharacterized protein NECHADRAFT_88863 [Fusarium vanettenii 77-13-4]EEU34572.1 predicted protein [Fusarium vanettenii 77-13-4]